LEPYNLETWNLEILELSCRHDLARVLPPERAVVHRLPHGRTRVGIAAATMVAVIGSWTPHAEEPTSDDQLIQRMVAETTRSDVAFKAFRELRAGTLNRKHQGWMDVETTVDPTGGFKWKVIGEGGSERTRNQVFREMMKAESDAAHRGESDVAALTPANYTFHRRPRSGAGQIEIGLEPRRQDPRLIVGTLTVTDDGTPVRLEGRLAKSPSFWVKSVAIVKRYESIQGVSLPTSIESIADVKFVGQSSFSMRYRYHEVNGQALPAPAGSTHEHSFDPSREILALFHANARKN
jgi:hypothetical protein